jgi:hypothetical protein
MLATGARLICVVFNLWYLVKKSMIFEVGFLSWNSGSLLYTCHQSSTSSSMNGESKTASAASHGVSRLPEAKVGPDLAMNITHFF